jgi:CheY-like chemotaxis protein
MAFDNQESPPGLSAMPARETILLVDDSEDDQILVREAFSRVQINALLQTVSSGDEAIAYLRGDGPFGNRNDFPMPSLVLLDLKMPRKSGFEVLEWIRTQVQLRTLRVVVLTASDAIWDIQRAYQLNATSFLVKPVDFQEFKAMCELLRIYWIGLNVTPTSPPQVKAARANIDPSAQ